MRLLVPNTVSDATLVSSSLPEDEALPWAAGVTYAAGDVVISTTTHSIFESLQAANTGRDPETSPAWWLRRGPTNRWAMFDGSASTLSTSDDGAIIVDLDAGAVEDATFVDLVADQVRITGAGVDITRSVPAPVAPATSVTLKIGGLGFGGGALRISITGSGTVSVGNVSLGEYVDLGETQHGASVSIIDYSRKVTDDFGNVSVVRRGYSRRVTARVAVLPSNVDTVSAQLAAVRATPCVWEVSPRHQALSVYGYYTDWQFDISFPTLAFFTITLESMYEEGFAVAPGGSVAPPPAEPVKTLSLLHFDEEGLPDAVSTNSVDISASAHQITSTNVFDGSAVTDEVYAIYSGAPADGRKITDTGVTIEAWVVPTFSAGSPARFNYVVLDKATSSKQIYAGFWWQTATDGSATTFSAWCDATRNYSNYTGFYYSAPYSSSALVHVALVLTTSSYAVYVNGTRVTSGSFSSAEYPDDLLWDDNAFFIVRNSSTSTTFRTDEARLSNVPRYSGATIIVPAAPFTLD